MIMPGREDASIRILANTLSKGLMLGCGVIVVGFLTRRLGVVAYGEYAALFAIAVWFRFPAEAFLQSSIIPRVAASNEPDRVAATYLRSISAYGIVSALAAMPIGILLGNWTSGFSINLWFPLCIDVLLLSVANGYLAILAGKGRFLSVAAIFGTYWIVRTLSTIVLVENGMGLLGVVLSLPVASSIQILLCAIQDRFSALTSPHCTWQEIRGDAKNYGFNIALERVLFTMDIVAMKILGADARAVGYYAAATSISQAFQSISGASSSIYLQSLTKSYARQDSHRFTHLCISMLRGRLVLTGLVFIALPFIPWMIRLLLGTQYGTIQWVVAIVLVSTSLKQLLSAGRILNRATSEPPEIRAFLIFLILLNLIGLASSIYLWPHGTAISDSEALWQAIRCALVPLLSVVAMTLYSLKLGLSRSRQPFPWKSAVRILTISAALVCMAGLLPREGPWGLVSAVTLAGFYIGFLYMLGEFKLRWSKNVSREAGHDR